ncbi:MAG: hypothetical protein HYU36_05230 [Planctomycetes bacterium]|nr:hypothetical protein [Planctomycetota bacterium]
MTQPSILFFLLALASRAHSAESESAVQDLARQVRNEQGQAEELALLLQGIDGDLVKLIEDGAKLDEQVIKIRKEQEEEIQKMEAASAPRAEEARRLAEARASSEQAVQQAIEARLPAAREAAQAWQRLRQLEAPGRVPQGRETAATSPVSPGNAGGGGEAGPPGPSGSRVPSSLSGPAWSQLQALAGLSASIEGTPEAIHETARQGWDTRLGHRHRALTESDIREDTLLKGSFRAGQESAAFQNLNFKTTKHYFDWARQQQADYRQKFVALKEELTAHRDNQLSLLVPTSGSRTLAQYQEDIRDAKTELQALQARRKDAESKAFYYNDLDLKEREPLQEIVDLTTRVTNDWNALPRENCAQSDIDGFLARNPGCGVSRHERQEGDRVITTWHLDTIGGKSGETWESERQAHYQRALEYYNKSRENWNQVDSLGQQMRGQEDRIRQFEGDLQEARERLTGMESDWRRALAAVQQTLAALGDLRLQYDALSQDTLKIVQELEKSVKGRTARESPSTP